MEHIETTCSSFLLPERQSIVWNPNQWTVFFPRVFLTCSSAFYLGFSVLFCGWWLKRREPPEWCQLPTLRIGHLWCGRFLLLVRGKAGGPSPFPVGGNSHIYNHVVHYPHPDLRFCRAVSSFGQMVDPLISVVNCRFSHAGST